MNDEEVFTALSYVESDTVTNDHTSVHHRFTDNGTLIVEITTLDGQYIKRRYQLRS